MTPARRALLPLADAASHLGVSRRTLEREAAEGRLAIAGIQPPPVGGRLE